MALGFHDSSAGTSSPRTWSLHPPPRAAFVPKRCLWQLGAVSVPSPWLSRLPWERDHSTQSSGSSVSPQHRGCTSNIPWKTLGRSHCQELFLSLGVQSLWENFHASKSWG